MSYLSRIILILNQMFRDVGKNDLTCGAGGGSDVHDVFAVSIHDHFLDPKVFETGKH